MTSRRRRRTKESSPTATEAGSGAPTPSKEPSTDERLPSASLDDAPVQSVLNIKVTQTADVDSTLERLQRVEGFRDIEPLFPGETHPELSKLYVAHIDKDRLAEAKPEIEADDDIEYVEEQASRKLI